MLTLFLVLPASAWAEEIDCTTRGNAIPGPAGTTRIVRCPAGCVNGPLWGSIIYSDDSAVCTAAIHSGHLKSEGGEVAVYIRGPQASYLGTLRNGITSSQYGSWSRSFSLADPSDVPTTRSPFWQRWGSAIVNWGVVLTVAVGVFLFFRRRKAQRAQLAAEFEDLAGRIGLTFERPEQRQAGVASGELEGFPVRVRTYTHATGSGSSRVATTYVECRVKLPSPLLAGVRAFPRSKAASIGAALDRLAGEHELSTRNAAFDESWYVASTDPTKRALLTDSVQRALLDYAGHRSDWELFLSGDEIRATRTFAVVSSTELEAVVRAQIRVAAALAV